MGTLPVWSHGWDAAIQAVVHEVSITFGFQLYNKHPKPESLDPKEPVFIPATCAVAAEHLLRQVRDNFFRQAINRAALGEITEKDYDNIMAAVADLHDEMLEPFKEWQKHVGLPPLDYKEKGHSWLAQLAELAVMFLLYTEASSLRHTPELMWLIYWIMIHSQRFMEVLNALHQESNGRCSRRPMMWIREHSQLHEREWWVDMGGSLASVRSHLRNMYLANDIRVQGQLFMRNARVDRPYRLLNNTQQFQALTRDIEGLVRQKLAQAAQTQALGVKTELEKLLQWFSSDLDGLLLALVAETAVLDDGSLFLDRVVQPFFTYLTQQVFQMGHDGIEAAKRVAYDDVNESCTIPEEVKAALVAIHVLAPGRGKAKINPDACSYDCLLTAGLTSDTPGVGELSEDRVEVEAGIKADWWGLHLFKKTFMERRTPFMVYRAFLRVYVFLAVYFHMLLAFAFADDNLEFLLGVTTISITHCGMMIVSEAAGLYGIQAMTTEVPRVTELSKPGSDKKKKVVVRMHQYWGAMRRHGIAFLMWTGVLLVLVAALANFRYDWIPALKKLWWVVSWGYIYTVLALEALRHSVAGYSLNSLGEILLGRGSAEKYMASRSNLATGQMLFLPNIFMWLCCFAIKVPLDYFAIVKPMEGIYDRIIRQQWYIYSYLKCEVPTAKGCSGFSFDWVLAAILMAPPFLTVVYDTGIIYQVVSAAFGTAYGLLFQRLGHVRRWDGVAASFLKAPRLWAAKGMSASGMRSIRNQLRQKKVFHRQASTAGVPLTAFGGDAPGPRRPTPLSYSASLLRGTEVQGVTEVMSKLAARSAYSEDDVKHVATQQAFLTPWNALVNDMRQRDLLSDSEMSSLLYEVLSENFEARAEQASGSSQAPPPPAVPRPDRTSRDTERTSAKTPLLPPVSEAGTPPKSTAFAGAAGMTSMVFNLGNPWRRPQRVRPPTSDEIELDAASSTTTLFPYLLPKAVAAGQVYEVLRTFSPSKNQLLIVWESYQWLMWLISRTGLINAKQEAILKLLTIPTRVKTTKQEKDRQTMLNNVVSLLECLPSTQLLEEFQQVIKAKNATGEQSAAAALAAHPGFVKMAKAIQEKAGVLVRNALDDLALAKRGTSKESLDRSNAEVVLAELEKVKDDPEMVGKIASAVAFMVRLNVGQNYSKVIKWLIDTLTKAEGDAVPENKEAQRIIYFFLSSLHNPQMPRAQPLHHMKSLTTLTPHYAETVMIGLDANDAEALLNFPKSRQDDDKTFLFDRDGKPTGTLRYLHTVYPEDWKNFCERMKNRAIKDGIKNVPQNVSEFDFLRGNSLFPLRHELLMWACLRGQPLARTVRGMMAYQYALAIVAKVEYPKPPDMTVEIYESSIKKLVDSKFNYCVTSQILGSLIAEKKDLTKRWTARGLEALMTMFPELQVSYVDSQKTAQGRNRQWSVLLQPGDAQAVVEAVPKDGFALENIPKKPTEVYRVRLPINYAGNRGVVLGEGKPENQNHAIIFCFGECVQTIDMNQDNVLAEAFKIRNLLAEFHDPKVSKQVALVGFREWIISQDCGALADFAASTELTFGSLVQRVMTVPSAVRFHYGHPDVWNKRFIMYRGGVSKANKGLHVSEDVFGGYNCTLRGGLIKFSEYMSVGKGRDMGFDSINGFEAKISAGNGEQVMSRDVYRLGSMFDFFRLMSWYHTGNGFFINTALTMFSVKVAAYSIAVLSLTGVIGDGVNPAVTSLQIVQLGSFSILVYAFTVALDAGIIRTVGDILGQMVAGSLFFFIFRAQTSAANFTATMRYGGAAYVATGRGFLLTTLPYEQIWKLFGRTHMYFGMDLALLLILATLVRAASFVYLLPSWLVVVALLLGPFWFNPFSFETKKVKSEFQHWMNWMNKNGSLKDDNCWKVWHKKDLARARNDSQQQTDRIWLVIWMLVCTAPSFILALSAVNDARSSNEGQPGFHPSRWSLFLLVAVPVYLLAAIMITLDYYYIKSGLKVSYRITRLVFSVVATVLGVGFFVIYLIRDGQRAKNFYILLYAMLQLLQAVKILLLFGCSGNALCRMFVDRLFYATDLSIGMLLFGLRYLLSLLGLVNRIQGTLLFNTAYARQYVFEQDMKGTELEAIVVEARRRIKMQ